MLVNVSLRPGARLVSANFRFHFSKNGSFRLVLGSHAKLQCTVHKQRRKPIGNANVLLSTFDRTKL